jgi:hypothetical protein
MKSTKWMMAILHPMNDDHLTFIWMMLGMGREAWSNKSHSCNIFEKRQGRSRRMKLRRRRRRR